jgi:hypothetical protein
MTNIEFLKVPIKGQEVTYKTIRRLMKSSSVL